MKRLILQVFIKLSDDAERGKKRFKPIPDMYELSEKQARHYAKEWHADYMMITDDSFLPGRHPIYQRFKMYEMYHKYDQIFYLDMDAIILPRCPNIFDEFKHEIFSAVRNHPWDDNLQKYEPIRKKYVEILNAQNDYRNFCSGVMLLSKKFFELTRGKWEQYLDSYDCAKYEHDQGIFNKLVIDELNGKYNELDEKWGPWYRSGKYIEHFGGPFRKHNFDVDKFKRKHGIEQNSLERFLI